ncbi:hypothetical protein IM25_05310 [Rhodococcus sp. p52]|nr:hypothetical protein IM25_05310 [Rhodococcus sp. p52]
MWRLTQGNALYTYHLVTQELREGRLRRLSGCWHWFDNPVISDSLADLIEQQIGSLSESVRLVVDTVAVAEPSRV